MQVQETGYAPEREDLSEGEDAYLLWIDEAQAAFDGFVPIVEIPELGEGEGENEPF